MILEKALSRALRLTFSRSVTAVGIGLMAHAAMAEEAPLQRVEVTGSSLKRVDAETALPVTVITKTEIDRTGATSTEQLLQSLTSLSSAGSTVGASGAGNGTGGISAVSLRGLGSSRTLVLVNGRRLAAFAGNSAGSVNVSAIPLAAIERIEILKDGASGVYGSDAVAGVINFILSKKADGVTLSGGYGAPGESGGGQNSRLSLTGGWNTDDLSVVLSGSYEKDKAIFGRDRDYARSATHLPYFSGSATGQGNIQGAYTPGVGKDKGFSNGASGYGNPLADGGHCDSIKMGTLQNGAMGTPYCYYDSGPDVGLTPDRELFNFTGNLNYKLGGGHELFADALYSRSKVTQTFQASPARASFFETDSAFADQGVDPALLLYPSNPAYQAIAVPYLRSHGFDALIGKPLAITSRVLDFGPRQNEDTSKQLRLVVGARGSVLGQDYEVALTHNESKLDSRVNSGYFSQVAYARIISDPNSGWNPWAAGGVQSGALADKLKSAEFRGATEADKSVSDIVDAKLSGDFFKLGEIQTQYAVGLQARHEKYITNPAEATRSGDISGLGGATPAVDRSRNVNSAFGELNLPLLTSLELNLTARDDRYNDVGNAANYKASVRWQPVKSLLLRGSYGTGFRAPTLANLWTPRVLSTSEGFNDPATNQTGLQVNSYGGGDSTLKPEKSRQYSVGVVWQASSNASIGADLFNVKIRNLLDVPSAQEIVSHFRAGDPAYAGLVKLDGNDVDTIIQTLRNTGDATVQGVDVNANWRGNFVFGRLDLGLNGTYMDTFDQVSGGGKVSHKVGTIVEGNGDPVIGAQNGGVVLRWKHQLSGTWSQGPWAVTLIENYRTGYQVGPDLNGNKVFIGGESTFDTNVSFKGFRNVSLAVGVRNLFDKQPETIGAAVTNQFQSGYDINQYDPRGRFVYVNASYKF